MTSGITLQLLNKDDLLFFTRFPCLLGHSVFKVWETAGDRDRIQFLEISPDPTVRHTVWTQVQGVLNIQTYGQDTGTGCPKYTDIRSGHRYRVS